MPRASWTEEPPNNARTQNGWTGHDFKGLNPVYTLFFSSSFLPYRNVRSSQRGVSLFEALIVLSVVATLTVVGVPSFREMLVRHEQVTAINTLVTALHLARSEAIKRITHVGICPSRDGRHCIGRVPGKTAWHFGYLLFVDQNGSDTRDDDETVIQYFGAIDRIRIYSGHGGNHVVVYRANGFATLTNDTFEFCDPSGEVPTRLVVLSNTGRPRVAPGNGGCPADAG